MNLLQPIIGSAGSFLNKIRNGYKISPFTPKDLFSRAKHQNILDAVNCFLNPQINPPTAGDVKIADGGWLIDLSRLAASVGSGGGGLNYRGLYSSSNDYSVNDVVYTSPDASTRISWVCEIPNDSGSPQSPTWTEPGTVYWRALAHFSTTDKVTRYVIDGHGTPGGASDNDHILAHPQAGGGSVNILKPPLICFSVSARNGVTYSSYDATNQTRLATAGGTSLTQYITPKYIVGDVIYVSTLEDGTTLADMNVDNRTFAAP